MPTIKFCNPASAAGKVAQLKTQLKAVEHELALGEDTNRGLVIQLSWEKDSRKEAQKKYAGLQHEQMKLQHEHTCLVLATATAEQENLEVQAKICHQEQEILNAQLDHDCNAEDCRQTLIVNNKLTQEAEALKAQLAAMQEARPMMAAQQTMRSPLRSLHGSPIGSVHTALPTVSTTQEVSGLTQIAEHLERRLAVAERKHLQRMQTRRLDTQLGATGEDKLKVKVKLPADIKEPACFMPTAGAYASVSSSQQTKGSLPLQGAAESSTPVAHAPAQGSLKIRLKLPVGLQQRTSRISSKPVAAPTTGKQVKGTLLQARAEGAMSLADADAADVLSSPTHKKGTPAKSPIAVSLPAVTSRARTSGSESSPGTPCRLDTATPAKALGTTGASKLQTMGQGTKKGAKKDLSLQGLRKMHTGFGIEYLYAPGGMLAELDVSSSPRPLPAIAKHAGPQAAAQTLAEQCSAAAEDAATTVQLSIAIAGQATGRTILPGPESATLGECLEDWCHSRGLCEDALTVYHFRKVVERELWGHTFKQLAWGSEVHLQVKVQDGLTGACQGAETYMQLPLSCCTNRAHLQAVNRTPMGSPDAAEYKQSTAAQSANGKALSTLLKHSPTCSSGTSSGAKASKPCTPLHVPSPQTALAIHKRSQAEPIAPGSTLSSRSSHSMCEALPGTPTRADLMTPAKGMSGRHTSTSSQQGWSSATSTCGYPFTSSPFAASQALSCKFTPGPSAELAPCLTRLPVPSLMDTNSTGSLGFLGLACVSTPATSEASNGSKTPAAANETTTVPSPAHMLLSETRQTLKHHILSPSSPACLLKPARRSSSISSRPERSSAYSCTSALHPSPMQRSTPGFPRRPMTPVSTAGTRSPAPAATATRSRRLSSTPAATPAMPSREAIRLPAGRSSSLAARLASTARTGPVSRPEADDCVTAARADEPSSTGLGATRPAAAAPADPTHSSTTRRSSAIASKPSRCQPAARAAVKATANSSVAAERQSAQPRRSGRQGSICTRPAPQTTAQPTADVNIATRPDSLQLRRSARQSRILARSAVCPTAPPPAAHATAPPAAASLRATAATAELDSCQLRRSARQSSLPPRPHTRASANANTSAKLGNAQTTGPASQGNPSVGRRHNTVPPSKPARQNSTSTGSAADTTAQSGAATTTANGKVAAEPEHVQLRRSARQSMKLTRPAGKATARGDASAEQTTVAPTKASRQHKCTANRVSTAKTGAAKQPCARVDAAQLKGQTKPASTKVTESKIFSSKWLLSNVLTILAEGVPAEHNCYRKKKDISDLPK